jgi:hypothetical protein
MAVTVKKAVLWRKEIDNRPGALGDALQPLAETSADLQVVMAYRYAGSEDRASVEVHPITGRKLTAAAQAGGFSPSLVAALLVEGDDRPRLGHAITKAIGDTGINMSFVMAQVLGRRYSAVSGSRTIPTHARPRP